jgi:hypothetical protein
VIWFFSEVIARHARSYEREEMIFDPRHHLVCSNMRTLWITRTGGRPAVNERSWSCAGQIEARENRDRNDPDRWSLVSVPIG